MTDTLTTLAARVTLGKRAEFEAAIAKRAGAGETIEGPHGPKPFDLSTGMREALDLWLAQQSGAIVDVGREEFEEVKRELELRRDTNPLVSTSTPGASRRHDRSTSRNAAADVAPRLGSQRRATLAAIAGAGELGVTTDGAIRLLEIDAERHGKITPAVNSIARRVTDLLERGAVEPFTKQHPAAQRARVQGDEFDAEGNVCRKTRHGRLAIVWIPTEKGLKWLEESAPS